MDVEPSERGNTDWLLDCLTFESFSNRETSGSSAGFSFVKVSCVWVVIVVTTVFVTTVFDRSWRRLLAGVLANVLKVLAVLKGLALQKDW